MAVPKQHRSKSRQGQRRRNIYLAERQRVSCAKCGKPVLAHTVCENCGTYRGRELIDVFSKLTKKEQKAKTKELKQQEGEAGELSMEELSKGS